jgi:hypothetical protein
MDTVEGNLQRSFSTQNANDLRLHQQSIAVSKSFRKKIESTHFVEFQSIELDLEKHSSIISSLLALGHNLLNEIEIRPRNIDSLTRSVQTLEQRWTLLKDLLRARKLEFDDIHVSWRNVDEAMKRASKMITDHERFLTELKRTSGDGLQGIRNEYKSLENFKRTLDDDDKIIQQVNNNYSEVLRIYPLADNNGEMRSRMKELNNRWEILNATFQESLKNVGEKKLYLK